MARQLVVRLGKRIGGDRMAAFKSRHDVGESLRIEFRGRAVLALLQQVVLVALDRRAVHGARAGRVQIVKRLLDAGDVGCPCDLLSRAGPGSLLELCEAGAIGQEVADRVRHLGRRRERDGTPGLVQPDPVRVAVQAHGHRPD